LLESRFRKIQRIFERIKLPDYTVFSFFAIITGAAAGLAAVLFHNSIEFLNEELFVDSSKYWGKLPWIIIIIPALGMLIQAMMIKLSPKTAKKKGVSEVIKAVALRGGYISFRTTVFHFIAPVICIGTGGTVGPEGPAAQIGGGIGSKLGNIFGLSDSRRRIFTAAGAGAAISAIFNTPLGGIFFALEVVLLNDFQTPTFSALILASVTASAIARILVGNESLFTFVHTPFNDYSNLYIYAIFGLFIGVLSIFFIRYSSFVDHNLRRYVLKIIPQWLLMTIVGLIVGIVGYNFKEIFGIGYGAINEFLNGSIGWELVLILVALKFILVPLILYSGGFGGLFAPSLFIGAGAGYLFAILVNVVWGLDLNVTTFVLVGMGAALGGINTIPISSILIIFEMTRDYSFILPLMLAIVVSTTMVQLILHGSVHTKHLEEQGYQIANGRESKILRNILIEDLKLRPIELIDDTTPLHTIVGKLIESNSSVFYVKNSDNKIIGAISQTELRPIIADYDSVKHFVVARDIMNPDIYIASPKENLDKILRLFGKYNIDEFPVIDQNKVLGTISRQDVIDCYNKESLKENLSDGLSDEIANIGISGETELGNYKIVEKAVPEEFYGKTLKELKFRNKYGLEILIIKRPKDLYSIEKDNYEILAPEADMKLKNGDVIVIFGSKEKIEKFNQI